MKRTIAGIVLLWGLGCAGCATAGNGSCLACHGDEERVFFPLATCGNGNLEAPFTVTPRQADQERACHPRVFVIDVRPFEQYAAGHLHDAVLIPAEQIPENIGANRVYPAINQGRSPQGNQRILVYGHSSVDGAAVVGQLRRMGYANSSYIEGGAAAWETAGLPLEFGDGL